MSIGEPKGDEVRYSRSETDETEDVGKKQAETLRNGESREKPNIETQQRHLVVVVD